MNCYTGACVDDGGVFLSFCDMGSTQVRKYEKPEALSISVPPEEEATGLDFGEFFKKKRLELGMTLRAFCREHDLNPGNISKLERGRVSAPCDEERLREYAGYLQLKDSEWEVFSDLAAISAGRIPADLTDEEVARRLPVLFRVARNKKVDVKKLEELIELIRRS